mmetsp:Transcript_33163/g.93906  ORF Transcript_33163/g.93906 Transcript_33163/m.93906 type:complete len:204 (-) Transcript_33163:470-1081(-)
MLIMWPIALRWIMSWTASREHKLRPITLVDIICTQEPVEPSMRDAFGRPTPALFMRMSMPEPGHLLAMMRGSASTSASFVMSQTIGRKSTGLTPLLSTSDCRCSRRSLLRAMATTLSPPCSSSMTIAHPLPEEAPVTTATLSAQAARPPGCCSCSCSAGPSSSTASTPFSTGPSFNETAAISGSATSVCSAGGSVFWLMLARS